MSDIVYVEGSFTVTGDIRWFRRPLAEGEHCDPEQDHLDIHRLSHHPPVLQRQLQGIATGQMYWEDIPVVIEEETS